MPRKKIRTREQVEHAITSTRSYPEAAASLNCGLRTFTILAKSFGLYHAKKSGGGHRLRFELSDILDGKHPQYPTQHLSRRLVAEGVKEYKCEGEGCQLTTSWCDKPITLQLDHIDGNSTNHRLDNLRLLCPNCHSQTLTYGSKKFLFKEFMEGCPNG